MASHWIDDRLNERIWIEDGMLYQFIQISFVAGLNNRHVDERATVYIMDLSPEFTGIFYDYTNPIFYKHLKSRGITFKEETIDFKIRNGRI